MYEQFSSSSEECEEALRLQTPMTFHKVYLWIVGIFIVMSTVNFSILGILINSVLFYTLYKRKTWAVKYVKCYSIYSIIVSVISIVMGFVVGYQINQLVGGFDNIIMYGMVSIISAIIDIIIAICIWIYYKKRRHMFIN